MYGKMIVFFALVALAASREYPAGLHPSVCPDYPNCDPAIFARFTPEGLPIPEWGYPSYYANVPAPAPIPAAPVARYPADFNAAACPNYPYCW